MLAQRAHSSTCAVALCRISASATIRTLSWGGWGGTPEAAGQEGRGSGRRDRFGSGVGRSSTQGRPTQGARGHEGVCTRGKAAGGRGGATATAWGRAWRALQATPLPVADQRVPTGCFGMHHMQQSLEIASAITCIKRHAIPPLVDTLCRSAPAPGVDGEGGAGQGRRRRRDAATPFRGWKGAPTRGTTSQAETRMPCHAMKRRLGMRGRFPCAAAHTR